MQKTGTALVLIILGLMVLGFPLLGSIPVSIVYGFIILLLGIGLIVAGLFEMEESAALGTLQLVLGVIALVLGVGCIFNPGLFSWVLGFLVWITGLFLVFAGIFGAVVKTGGSRWNGVAAIVIGVLFMVFGHFMANPVILGILIGLWLIIAGITMLMSKETIDVPEYEKI
jgi:uncharacterized membrane protein HdeD (DUF308 family)